MRQIKFRCWDIYNKEMLDVQELDYEDSYNGQPMVRTTMYNDYFDTEDMILMQFTGLHDKNGKEIYEGDIVKYMAIADGEQTDKVIFDRGTFVVDYSEDYKQPINEINHCAEVIGNLYENPELLERSNNGD